MFLKKNYNFSKKNKKQSGGTIDKYVNELTTLLDQKKDITNTYLVDKEAAESTENLLKTLTNNPYIKPEKNIIEINGVKYKVFNLELPNSIISNINQNVTKHNNLISRINMTNKTDIKRQIKTTIDTYINSNNNKWTHKNENIMQKLIRNIKAQNSYEKQAEIIRSKQLISQEEGKTEESKNKKQIKKTKVEETVFTEEDVRNWAIDEGYLQRKVIQYLAENPSHAEIWLDQIKMSMYKIVKNNIVIWEFRLADITRPELKVYQKKNLVGRNKCENLLRKNDQKICEEMIKIKKELENKIKDWKKIMLKEVTKYIKQHWEKLDTKKLKETLKSFINDPIGTHIMAQDYRNNQNTRCLGEILDADFTIDGKTKKLRNFLYGDEKFMDQKQLKYLRDPKGKRIWKAEKFSIEKNKREFNKECSVSTEKENEKIIYNPKKILEKLFVPLNEKELPQKIRLDTSDGLIKKIPKKEKNNVEEKEETVFTEEDVQNWAIDEGYLQRKEIQSLADNPLHVEIWLDQIKKSMDKNVKNNIVIWEFRLADITRPELKVYQKKNFVGWNKCENLLKPNDQKICKKMIKIKKELENKIKDWKKIMLKEVTKYIKQHWEKLDTKKLKETLKSFINDPIGTHIMKHHYRYNQNTRCLGEILDADFTIDGKTKKLRNFLYGDEKFMDQKQLKYLRDPKGKRIWKADRFSIEKNKREFNKECSVSTEEKEGGSKEIEESSNFKTILKGSG